MRILSIGVAAAVVFSSSLASATASRFYATAEAPEGQQFIDAIGAEGVRADATFKALRACTASGASLCEAGATRLTTDDASSPHRVAYEASVASVDGRVDATKQKDFTESYATTGALNNALLPYASRGGALANATFACEHAGYETCVFVSAETTEPTITGMSSRATFEARATVRGYVFLEAAKPAAP